MTLIEMYTAPTSITKLDNEHMKKLIDKQRNLEFANEYNVHSKIVDMINNDTHYSGAIVPAIRRDDINMYITHLEGFVMVAHALPTLKQPSDFYHIIVKLSTFLLYFQRELKFVHGDLHTGNVMYNINTKQCAVIDFGASTFLADKGYHKHTHLENVYRSPLWMLYDMAVFMAAIANECRDCSNLNMYDFVRFFVYEEYLKEPDIPKKMREDWAEKSSQWMFMNNMHMVEYMQTIRNPVAETTTVPYEVAVQAMNEMLFVCNIIQAESYASRYHYSFLKSYLGRRFVHKNVDQKNQLLLDITSDSAKKISTHTPCVQYACITVNSHIVALLPKSNPTRENIVWCPPYKTRFISIVNILEKNLMSHASHETPNVG